MLGKCAGLRRLQLAAAEVFLRQRSAMVIVKLATYFLLLPCEGRGNVAGDDFHHRFYSGLLRQGPVV